MKRVKRTYVIIPAAGKGMRMGGRVQKQFLRLGKRTILIQTVSIFERCKKIDGIVLAVPEEAVSQVRHLVNRNGFLKVISVVAGGLRRQDSVFNALRTLPLLPDDIVLVHDGVRPFIEERKILEVIQAVSRFRAAVLSVAPKDTVRTVTSKGLFGKTIDRRGIQLIQTPQGFRADDLVHAFSRAMKKHINATDDAALVERIGVRAKVLEGSYDNIKITTHEDLELARVILRRWRKKA